MLKIILASCLILLPLNALAAWKVDKGNPVYRSFAPRGGKIATVMAKAPYKNIKARLQLECFVSPSLNGLSFFIVLSKNPPNGFMAHRYQFDDGKAVTTKPFSRTLPANAITLGDDSSDEVKGLASAKVLKLTLLPADGSELRYEFNVSGAAAAIKAIACKESS
jgi:hypothetical protein